MFICGRDVSLLQQRHFGQRSQVTVQNVKCINSTCDSHGITKLCHSVLKGNNSTPKVSLLTRFLQTARPLTKNTYLFADSVSSLVGISVGIVPPDSTHTETKSKTNKEP